AREGERRGRGRRDASEEEIDVAAIGAARVLEGGADDQVIDPVAVDVPRSGDGVTELSAGLGAVQRDHPGDEARAAEVDEDPAEVGAAVGGDVVRVVEGGADREIWKAVAVEVASRGDRESEAGPVLRAVEKAGSGGERTAVHVDPAPVGGGDPGIV